MRSRDDTDPTVTARERYHRARERLGAKGQGHVLAFWDDLEPREREVLLAQIEGIDLDLIERLATATVTAGGGGGEREPAPVLGLGEEPEGTTRREARRRGEELLRRRRVAVFLVAGGQGSRLGLEGPKGCVSVGPVSGRTLFQYHAEKIWRLGRRYGQAPPCYIMTSPANDAATREYFEAQEFFGLDPGEVVFMPQSTLPAVDDGGRLLLEAKHQIFTSPNGHGGSFEAFSRCGFDHALSRGIEHIFYFQVDNPLVGVADPVFLGLHDLLGSEMSLKVIAKEAPEEKLGVAVLESGRPRVVEYSDLSPEETSRKGPHGRLLYWAGSLAIHAFSMAFLRRLAGEGPSLPYHVARKEIPALDRDGRPVTVAGRKFETFVFDALPRAGRFLVVETARHEEFAPVKSLRGPDSLESSRERLAAEARRWLREAGVEARGPAEISPRVALDPEELRAALGSWRGRSFAGGLVVEFSEAGEVVLRS